LRAVRKRPGLVKPIARLGAAAALGVAARGRLAEADEEARKLIYRRRFATFDKALPVLTDLGSTYAIAGATGALLALGRKRMARDVAVAGGLAWLAAQGAKPLFAKARPYDIGTDPILVRKPAGLSYPSGHPAVTAAIAAAIEDDVHEPVRGVLKRLARMVAFSRVYVGVHYPTDVIGGLLIGRSIGELWRRYAPRS
jgi:undecaprenyl-diphosphatase